MTRPLHAEEVIQQAQDAQRDRRHMAALISDVIESVDHVADDGTVVARLAPHLYAALQHRTYGGSR